jgi:hypothetical protein
MGSVVCLVHPKRTGSVAMQGASKNFRNAYVICVILGGVLTSVLTCAVKARF